MTDDNIPRTAGRGVSRRTVLRGGVAAVTLGSVLGPAGSRLIDTALAGSEGVSGGVGDIEHFVILMQENRSFDHYFGTMSGVRGFSDPHAHTYERNGHRYSVFDQFGFAPGKGVDADGYLQPYRLLSDPPDKNGQVLNDISHNWGPQHQSWNNGRMDSWMTAHLTSDGAENAPEVMGYYTRAELPFYYALADAFTICDAYHCSVLGPTSPNRLMSVAASLDPNGEHGGPYVETTAIVDQMTLETMPDRLTKAGVTWKAYNDPSGLALLNPLGGFKAFAQPSGTLGAELFQRAFSPTYPADFAEDVANGSLPSVSWIFPNAACCEHPSVPPAYGEYLVHQVLGTLVSNPDVWAKTALIIHYDENGGFFDHVVPPTPPPGTEGEYLTVKPLPSSASGIAGPIGLGFRVPGFVVSPYSRGGWVATETFDITSTLRLLETRFHIEVPNLTPWRRSVTGDLTSAFGSTSQTSVPALPATPIGDINVAEQIATASLLGSAPDGHAYPPPTSNSMPTQATTPKRRRRTPH